MFGINNSKYTSVCLKNLKFKKYFIEVNDFIKLIVYLRSIYILNFRSIHLVVKNKIGRKYQSNILGVASSENKLLLINNKN